MQVASDYGWTGVVLGKRKCSKPTKRGPQVTSLTADNPRSSLRTWEGEEVRKPKSKYKLEWKLAQCYERLVYAMANSRANIFSTRIT